MPPTIEPMSKYDLVDNFPLPLSQAAKHFKVSETFLKKVCRMHNIPRWPYRKAHHDRSIISVSFDFYATWHHSWVDGPYLTQPFWCSSQIRSEIRKMDLPLKKSQVRF